MTSDLPNVSKGWEYFSHPRPPHAAAVSSLPRPGLLTCMWAWLLRTAPSRLGPDSHRIRPEARRKGPRLGRVSSAPAPRSEASSQ